jgi:hypothetical protein
MSARDLKDLDLNNILPEGSERNKKDTNQTKSSDSEQNQDAEQSSYNLKLDQTTVLDQDIENYADNTFWTSNNQTTDLDDTTSEALQNLPPLVHRLIPQKSDILKEEYETSEIKYSDKSELKAEESENKSEKKTDSKQNKSLTEAVRSIAKGISNTLGITQPSTSRDSNKGKESEFETSPQLNTSNLRRPSLENIRGKKQNIADRSRGLSSPAKFSSSPRIKMYEQYDVNEEVGKYFTANENDRKKLMENVPLGKEYEFLEKLIQDKDNLLQPEFKNKLRIKLASLLLDKSNLNPNKLNDKIWPGLDKSVKSFNGNNETFDICDFIFQIDTAILQQKRYYAITDTDIFMSVVNKLHDAPFHLSQRYLKKVIKDGKNPSWDDFKKELKEIYYAQDEELNLRSRLSQLRVDKSLKIYNDEFMKLAAKLDSLTEMDLLEKYLNGLDRDEREKIMLTHPEDLKDAQSKAIIYYNMSSRNTVSVNAITKPINHIPRRSNHQNRNYQQNNQQNSFRNNQQNNYRNNYKNNQHNSFNGSQQNNSNGNFRNKQQFNNGYQQNNNSTRNNNQVSNKVCFKLKNKTFMFQIAPQ